MPLPWAHRLPQRARVVEIGVGGRWSTAVALLGIRPDLRLSATDVHEHHLAGAPPGVSTFQDDVTDPQVERYRGAQLLYMVRCPEELQAPIARLATAIGSAVALHTLKDERAALDQLLGPSEQRTGPDGRTWRAWGLQANPGSR